MRLREDYIPSTSMKVPSINMKVPSIPSVSMKVPPPASMMVPSLHYQASWASIPSWSPVPSWSPTVPSSWSSYYHYPHLSQYCTIRRKYSTQVDALFI